MMKRTIFAMAVLAASVCVADEVVSSSNLIGLLPVTSSAKRTIVSVPWCAMSATDDSSIQVSNLVKTANLTTGDMLHYVQPSGSYLSWRLTNGADDVKYWQSVNIATENGEVTYTPTANSQTVARGNCIVLIRQSYTNDNGTGKTFYLYGQVGTNTSVTTAMAVGSAKSPAYSLISSPSVSAWRVNSGTWSNVGTSDNIFVPGANGWNITLYRNSDKWCVKEDVYETVGGQQIRTGTKFTEYSTTIPAGQGVWYVSKSDGETPSVTW